MKKAVLIVFTLLLAAVCGYAETNSDKSGKDDKAVIQTPKFVKALKAHKKQHIAVFGTSLTEIENRWPGVFMEEMDKRYPGLVTITNVAASGMDSCWGFYNVEKRVIPTQADIVFIEFGINDAKDNRFRVEQINGYVSGMVKKIHEGLPDCEVILMTMNGSVGGQGRRRPNQANMYKVYQDVADEMGLLCIDHYPNWLKSIQDGTFGKYCPDTLHPNRLGYQEVFMPEMIKMLNLDGKEPGTHKPGGSYSVPADKQEMRTWTSASGTTIEAKLVKMSGRRLGLAKADGSMVQIALDRISAEDQAYVEKLMGE